MKNKQCRVLVGGAFDIIHYGHICLLKWCKSLGDELIVQLASDERIRYKKGKGRPIFHEKERAKVLKSIKYVDRVFIFRGEPEDNPVLTAIKRIKPDIYIRNYEGNENSYRDEMELCKALDIKIVFHRDFPRKKNKIHSSDIINYLNL